MPEFSLILDHLTYLYGQAVGQAAFERLLNLIEKHRQHISPPGDRGGEGYQLSERDSILITYADQVREPRQAPLRTLADFLQRHLLNLVSGIHLLPFFPWSSDDGFSVIDYRSVDPALGEWKDIDRLGMNFRLMFDGVINHVSVRHAWFQSFLMDDPTYQEYFISVEGDPDLSGVVRPRALPLLTRFDTPSGPKRLWTTFSEDQVDLNYRNPDVLLEIVDTLLFYASRGAEFIRLDAIAYLWKEIGTASIHLPQTHRVIQLLRAVLDVAAPHALLVTETNVPHEENISYFGDGANEAQLVYNFALPPLVLHTFRTGEASIFSDWAAGLTLPAGPVTFFNFLASHDGIGVNPARGILSEIEIEALVAQTQARGGLISYKHNPDGTQSAYELNINYFDALSNPESGEASGPQVDRFMAAQAIMLAIVGMPGIYFHSLFGSRGWPEGVRETGRSRTINRQKLELAGLERALADPSSLRHHMFKRYSRLLRARAASPAFHPFGEQRILDLGKAVFSVVRRSPDGSRVALCLHNVSGKEQHVAPDWQGIFGAVSPPLKDLISGQGVQPGTRGEIPMHPYQVIWLVREDAPNPGSMP
ncbi:MAG TPA: sugar phosphorylase [Anaerolineales bacterium]